MSFPDASSAEVVTPRLDPLKSGSRYAFFLETIEETIEKFRAPEPTRPELAGAYVPKLGAQGVYELRSDGVKAFGRDPAGFNGGRAHDARNRHHKYVIPLPTEARHLMVVAVARPTGNIFVGWTSVPVVRWSQEAQ